MPRLSRPLLAAVAAVPPVALLLWRRGGGYDTPIDTFKTCGAAAALFVLGCVVLAFVVLKPAGVGQRLAEFIRRRRRWAALVFGFVFACLLVGMVELAFRAIKPNAPGVVKETGHFVEPDPLLGYRLLPGAEADASATFGAETIYKTHYSIDALGHRRTAASPAAPKRAVAFFGCSFTFGEGLTDGETLASQYALHAPDRVPVNLGVPGHGPNHMLARLEDDRPLGLPDCPEPPLGVYLYMDAHVDRCVGAMYIVNHFGADAPYYDYADGRVTRLGDFLRARPARSVTYWLLGKSATLEHFGFNWPPAGRASSLELTGDVVARAAEEFKRRTGGELAMAVYPGCRFGRAVGERAKAGGVRVLDYTDLFDPAKPGFAFPHDGHPAPPAMAQLATRLAADLAVP
jgi:hypothetical protein